MLSYYQQDAISPYISAKNDKFLTSEGSTLSLQFSQFVELGGHYNPELEGTTYGYWMAENTEPKLCKGIVALSRIFESLFHKRGGSKGGNTSVSHMKTKAINSGKGVVSFWNADLVVFRYDPPDAIAEEKKRKPRSDIGGKHKKGRSALESEGSIGADVEVDESGEENGANGDEIDEV